MLVLLAACTGAPPPPAVPVAPTPAPTAPPAVAPPAVPSLSGVWLGTLRAGGKGLRIQLRLDLATTPAACAIDSLDQRAMGIPCTNVVASASVISFDVPAVRGALKGTPSADGNTLNTMWSQGGAQLELVLTRQTAAVQAAPPALDPAMPPVEIAQLKSVIDADLASGSTLGDLAPATGGGATIGVVSHGKRLVWTYGAAKANSVFEIGSISKTFTGLILAQMAAQNKVKLDEPVRALLPAGTVAAPASGREITLLDLSAQRSGLPRLPDNLKPADMTNPYADYDVKALYAYVAGHGVALPDKPVFEYSNLGVGLLGQALAERAHTTYEALLKKQITNPLGMRDTVITIPAALHARFIEGHDGEHKPARAWDIPALAGAGAIRSTAGDMLTYLEVQLHPDHLPATARSSAEGKTLAAAIAASHEIRGEVGAGVHIALNWFHDDAAGWFWHNGATGGYSAFAVFDPEKDFAVIVLTNTSPGDTQFADRLGGHIAQRMNGTPAVSLKPAVQ
jgi:CubicO group peptidase (beta-lactamase class C family)